MFWWILLGLSGVVLIVGIILVIISNVKCIDCDTAGGVMAVISFIVLFFSGLIISVICFTNNKEIATFISQKEYFETVVPTLPDSDNYALTQKKIELNEWLYKAQYEKKYYPFFSLYSDKILELTEIR